jgi:5-exo-hydroxycamphor dehydrogenase
VPCLQCDACRSGRGLAYCARYQWPIPWSVRPNAAAFQDYATIGPTAPLYRIPDHTSSEAVIAFGCAMHTAVSAFERLGGVTGTVVVQGAGPVGLACTALASIHGTEQVIVIGEPDERRNAAAKLGATHTIPLADTTQDERRDDVLALTSGRGADAVIEAAGHISAFAEGIHLLAEHGRYVILGLYSGDAAVPVNPVLLNNRNLSIIGCLSDALSNFAPALDIAAAHGDRLRFADLITHRFSLQETEAAIKAAAAGIAVKSVVVPA